MIVENACLILQIFPMDDGETREEVPTDWRSIAVSPLDVDLLDVSVRLTRLLDAPAEARVLLPLITREMIYRLRQAGRTRS